MSKLFSEQVVDLIKLGVEQCGSAAALSRATGVTNANISRWLKQGQLPHVDQLDTLFEMLGVSISVRGAEASPSSDVQFVEPHIVPAGDGTPPPLADDYLAIPVVDEIMVRPGPVSPLDIRSWFLVCRDTPTLRYKKDLLAVIKDSVVCCQEPVLHGGDIVLVDREDRQPGRGDFMLVSDPKGRTMICRVSESDDGASLTYFSDSKLFSPKVYSIKKDFGGDARKAILGKVLFGWLDLQGR